MKHLMLTTALATATAFGAAAQTASTGMSDTDASAVSVPGFLASDFTGKTLYTLDSEAARAVVANDDASADAERHQQRWTSSDAFLSERDDWRDIGSIDDIVLSMDGAVQGVLLDVGGVLGFGSHTVMVDIDELYFVPEDGAPDGLDDVSIVIAMSQEQLEDLPEWDSDRLATGFDARVGADTSAASSAIDTETAGGSNGTVFGDEHRMIEAEERTADRLLGADVYGAEGDNIGAVNDVVIGADDRISDVIVDVGGFLGIGAHTVRLPVEEAQIGWNEDDESARVQVMMTAEQLENLPAYEG